MKAIQLKIQWLMERKLAWGCAVLVMTNILGYLPSLDFLDPKTLKLISFGLGVLLTTAKGIEMFFEQSVQLAKASEPVDNGNPDRGDGRQ